MLSYGSEKKSFQNISGWVPRGVERAVAGTDLVCSQGYQALEKFKSQFLSGEKTKTLPTPEERDLIAYTLNIITVRYWKDSKTVRAERGTIHVDCQAKLTILALVGISLGVEEIDIQVTGAGCSKGGRYPLDKSQSSEER